MPGTPSPRTLPRLYAILDADVSAARGVSPEALLDAWLSAGVRLIQLRAKTISFGPMLALAERLAVSCREAGAIFLVNDRADVARLSGAAGVHVGQDDLSPAEVRRVAPALSLVGLSTHNEAQVREALAQPIDYLAVGPVFSTASKARPDAVIGLEGIRRAASLARDRSAPVASQPPVVPVVPVVSPVPVVAIGGITLETAADVIGAGAASVAVIADLLAPGQPPRARAAAYLDRLSQVAPSPPGW